MSDFVYTPPHDPWLDIVYQDEAIIVLNKPSGLLSVPGRLPEHHDSIAVRVINQFEEAHVVHRLDMATSGILLMALTKDAQRHISRQFQRRTTDKHYIARLEGIPTSTNGSVDLPMRCDWENRPRQIIDFDQGKPALTHWKILSVNETQNTATVLLKPVTGRSHQLRLHSLALGTPILGDELYASEAGVNAVEHLQLHAEMLTITHPTTQKQVTFTAPAPFKR